MSLLGIGLGRRQNMKGSVVNSAINLLEKAVEPQEIHLVIQKTISNEVSNDQDIQFLLRGFSMKFGLPTTDMYIRPLVEEGTLNIKKWQLICGDVAIFQGAGINALADEITKAVLTKGEELESLIKKLEGALAKGN